MARAQSPAERLAGARRLVAARFVYHWARAIWRRSVGTFRQRRVSPRRFAGIARDVTRVMSGRLVVARGCVQRRGGREREGRFSHRGHKKANAHPHAHTQRERRTPPASEAAQARPKIAETCCFTIGGPNDMPEPRLGPRSANTATLGPNFGRCWPNSVMWNISTQIGRRGPALSQIWPKFGQTRQRWPMPDTLDLVGPNSCQT